MSETCQKCGEEGSDRRTLKMACFYDMTELDVPFENFGIYGSVVEFGGLVPNRLGNISLPGETASFKPPGPDAKQSLHDFYTLRVCKECRADWMQAIQEWFKSGRFDDQGNCIACLNGECPNCDGSIPCTCAERRLK